MHHTIPNPIGKVRWIAAVATWLLLALTTLPAELYIIRANPGVTLVRLETLVTDPAVGGRVTQQIVYNNLGYIAVVADILTLPGLRTLINSGQVRSEPLLLYQSGDIAQATLAACASTATPWSLDEIDGTANGIYQSPLTAKPVHLYLLDSGLISAHCEFSSLQASGQLIVPEGYESILSLHPGKAHLADQLGHGTAVASCILGQRGGVASLAPVVLHSYGIFGSVATTPSVAVLDGLLKARTDHQLRAINDDPYDNASVINLSLASETPQASCEVEDAIHLAFADGMMVVAAAGNRVSEVQIGTDCAGNGIGNDPEEGYSPARLDEVFTVGAYVQNSTLWTSDKSLGTNTGSAIDILAPGAGIPTAASTSTTQFRTNQAGTSYAAAYVSGIAINILSCNPLATPAEVANAIQAAAANGGGLGVKLARQSPTSIPSIEATYAQWLAAYGPIPPTEVSDHDGIPLALEFFAGRNAKVDDGAPVLWVGITDTTIDLYFEKARYVGNAHTQFGIEQSSDLQNWTPTGAVPAVIGGDCFVQTYKASIPIASGERYYRLQVSILQ
ncbi:MAG: S8 family serine peptidase [Verrucomicrobiales bacterium]